MTTPKDGVGSQHTAETEQSALYEALGGVLRSLLMRAFELPEQDAEWLLRESIIDYTLNKQAPDARAWLIGVACRNANGYRQRRGLPAANEAEAVRQITAVLATRDALATLPRRAREALRLKFDEKKSYEEVAEQLGLSVHAAKRFVSKALTQMRAALSGE